MSPPSDSARPVAVVVPNTIGVDMVWIEPPPKVRPPIGTELYTAADYDALRAEVERLTKDYRVAADLAKQSQDLALQQCARAEAAEAKVVAILEFLPEIESRIRAAAKNMPGSKKCVIAKIELEEAGSWLAAFNKEDAG